MTFTIPIDNGDAVKNAEADSQRTLYPYVTGTSIVAIKYKDGVLMASDMGGVFELISLMTTTSTTSDSDHYIPEKTSISPDRLVEDTDSTKQLNSETHPQSSSSETTTAMGDTTVSEILEDNKASEKPQQIKESSFSKADDVNKIEEVEQECIELNKEKNLNFEEKQEESEVQRLLEAEKRRLFAEIELGSIFGKRVDVDNDVDKRSVKIELIDDTLLVNVVSKRPGSAYTDKELPRKHKKIGVKAKVSDVHSCGENNGEQFRRLYPREQLESMRFAHIVNQRKVWSEMYGRLLPEVVTEYESLVCLKNHKTSKSNLVRGKGQKESGIGENLGTEEGMEDLNGEDYTDDNDDYKSILKPAFAVDGEPDFSTGPPEDGLEYLRRVRWEAKGFPNVKIAKIDESKYIKKEQSVYMPLIPEIPKCPEYLLPVKEWEDLLISDFLHLRQALSQNADSCENEIISNQSVEDLLIEIFNKRLHIENDESFGGMVSEIQGMDSVTRISKLKKRICLVEKESGIESSDCKWVVALCASLDTPLDADTSACLRGLLRKCAIVRAEKSLEVGDEEVTTMANILITIAGRYFGQMGQ